MHGAGNDFILVDDRDNRFPIGATEWLRSVSARRTGIGSDGFILIQTSDIADFRMRFINPDGGEVDLCGNGVRCVARLANELGVAGEEMSVQTGAGVVTARVQDNSIQVEMPPPKDWQFEKSLEVSTGPLTYSAVDTGVPHVVITVDDLNNLDINEIGLKIRHHEEFSPAGTNVDFVQITGPSSLKIRTYERGVERETLACGTGIVAVGILGCRSGVVSAPVQVTCAGGDVLEVNCDLTDEAVENITLTGPAIHVYQGTIEHQS